MEYTGGSIILTITSVIFAVIGLVVSMITLVSSIIKNENINKARKIEYTVFMVSAIVISIFIGGTISYYLGILKML